MKLYKADPPYESDYLFQCRKRLVEWWGNCGPVRFPIIFYVEEARRIEKRKYWFGYKKMSNWFKIGPDTYSSVDNNSN